MSGLTLPTHSLEMSPSMCTLYVISPPSFKLLAFLIVSADESMPMTSSNSKARSNVVRPSEQPMSRAREGMSSYFKTIYMDILQGTFILAKDQCICKNCIVDYFRGVNN